MILKVKRFIDYADTIYLDVREIESIRVTDKDDVSSSIRLKSGDSAEVNKATAFLALSWWKAYLQQESKAQVEVIDLTQI